MSMTKSAAWVCQALLLAALAPGTVRAQEPPLRERTGSPVADFISGDQGSTPSQEADAFPDLPDVTGLDALDPLTREAALDAIREYYRYRQSGYEHRRRVFDWQLQSSRIIFWVVILMVSAGIYFSGVQFHIALRAAARPSRVVAGTGAAAPAVPAVPMGSSGSPGAPGAPGPGDLEHRASALYTSLEAGTGGVKVSSPVLGVIVLVISFLFFYMYLVHVYPISEIM